MRPSALHDSSSCSSCSKSRRKKMWGKSGNEGKHVSTFRETLQGRQVVCTQPEGLLGAATSRGIGRVHPAPGKLAVAENGRGVEWAVCRITKNDGVLSGWRQVERHGRTHPMISSSNNSTERSHGERRSGSSSAGAFAGPATSRGGGNRSGPWWIHRVPNEIIIVWPSSFEFFYCG